MKSKVLWTLGALLIFFVFLVAYLPASQVIHRLSLPDDIGVYDVSGSIWHGRAGTVVVQGIPVDNVNWQLSPWRLLTGTVHGSIEGGNLRAADEVSFKGEIETSMFSMQNIQSDDFLLFLPVDRVLAQIQLPLPVNAGGRFRVRLEDVSFGPSCYRLDGFGDWLNATVAGTRGPIDFGNYSAELRCEGEGIGIHVDEPNKLGLTLDATLNAQFNQFRVSGQFRPDESLPQEVHDAAAIFGQPNAEGYTEFRL